MIHVILESHKSKRVILVRWTVPKDGLAAVYYDMQRRPGVLRTRLGNNYSCKVTWIFSTPVFLLRGSYADT